MANLDSSQRLVALRRLLVKGKLSTQEELRRQLTEQSFQVTQSTVSRDLRRLGAIRAVSPEGQVAYKLPAETAPLTSGNGHLSDMIVDVRHNGAMIVISTSPGSASLVARHIDLTCVDIVLGTVAGDDAVFVAPTSVRNIADICEQLISRLKS